METILNKVISKLKLSESHLKKEDSWTDYIVKTFDRVTKRKSFREHGC